MYNFCNHSISVCVCVRFFPRSIFYIAWFDVAINLEVSASLAVRVPVRPCSVCVILLISSKNQLA